MKPPSDRGARPIICIAVIVAAVSALYIPAAILWPDLLGWTP